jgi:RNA polymerase sigma-32 factor
VSGLHRDAALARYISSVDQAPKLSREEELGLARCYVETRDAAARELLIRAHLRYVLAIAVKYRRYQVPLSELIAEGNVGLLHALDKFDPERGHRFLTYGAYWVRAHILNYIIGSWSMVGAGSGALRSKVFFKVRRERVRVINLVGDGDEADALLAQKLNLSQHKIKSMTRQLEARDVSLDAKVFDASAATLRDVLVSADANQEETLSHVELQSLVVDAVQGALRDLDQRERYIAEKRLMADSENELSLADIGRNLGVSRERARQIEARAKRKLRNRIAELSSAAGGWLESA